MKSIIVFRLLDRDGGLSGADRGISGGWGFCAVATQHGALPELRGKLRLSPGLSKPIFWAGLEQGGLLPRGPVEDQGGSRPLSLGLSLGLGLRCGGVLDVPRQAAGEAGGMGRACGLSACPHGRVECCVIITPRLVVLESGCGSTLSQSEIAQQNHTQVLICHCVSDLSKVT